MNVSIVTPVYNEPQVARALDSIQSQQDVEHIESIVVDGGSTDETVDILDEYRDDIDILVQEPDDGLYDAMNKGIERANNEVIGILNADDRYQDQHVLRDVLDLLGKTDAEICYGDLVYVNDEDDVVRYWHSGEYRPRRFYTGWVPPHPTVFVQRSVYEQVGLFDLDYPIAADYEFLLRALFYHDIDATYVNRVLVRMSLGGKSNESVGNIVRGNVEAYRAWRKHNLLGGVLVPFFKPARKITQYISTPPESTTSTA